MTKELILKNLEIGQMVIVLKASSPSTWYQRGMGYIVGIEHDDSHKKTIIKVQAYKVASANNLDLDRWLDRDDNPHFIEAYPHDIIKVSNNEEMKEKTIKHWEKTLAYHTRKTTEDQKAITKRASERYRAKITIAENVLGHFR